MQQAIVVQNSELELLKGNQNPEQNLIPEEESKAAKTSKKKNFKIKKSKHFSTTSTGSLKRINSYEIFNNPLYADLQDELNLDSQEENFGPWIHEKGMKGKSRGRSTRLLQVPILPINETSRVEEQERLPGRQVQGGQNERGYLQAAIEQSLQDSDSNFLTHTRLPSIQHATQRRRFEDLKKSSLRFDAEQARYSPSLSPPKMMSNSTKYMGGNSTIMKSKVSVSTNLIKYASSTLRNSPQMKRFQKQVNNKPSKVMYNYCCSNFQGTSLHSPILGQWNSKKLNGANDCFLNTNINRSNGSKSLKSLIRAVDQHQIGSQTVKNKLIIANKQDENNFFKDRRSSISKELHMELQRRKAKKNK